MTALGVLLYLTFDSADPCTMTKGFLESGVFNDVHKHFNVCTDGKYTYSPTMCVHYGLYQSNKEYHADLVTLPNYSRKILEEPRESTRQHDTIQEERLKRVAEQKRRDKIRQEINFRAEIEQEETKIRLICHDGSTHRSSSSKTGNLR
jgi:hypothetical protein